MYAEYFDKYGAPLSMHESWVEGYREVEKQLALVSTASTVLFQCSNICAGAISFGNRPFKCFLYKALGISGHTKSKCLFKWDMLLLVILTIFEWYADGYLQYAFLNIGLLTERDG